MLRCLLIKRAVPRKDVSFQNVQRELEEQQVSVLAMGVDRDARDLDAIKAQRAEQHTAKPMAEEEGVNIWGALKALKERQITV